MNAKADLEAKGLNTVWPTNHVDFTESLYFFAPSGHRLKRTIRTYNGPTSSRAPAEICRRRVAGTGFAYPTPDGSQRDEMFGAHSAYSLCAQWSGLQHPSA